MPCSRPLPLPRCLPSKRFTTAVVGSTGGAQCRLTHYDGGYQSQTSKIRLKVGTTNDTHNIFIPERVLCMNRIRLYIPQGPSLSSQVGISTKHGLSSTYDTPKVVFPTASFLPEVNAGNRLMLLSAYFFSSI